LEFHCFQPHGVAGANLNSFASLNNFLNRMQAILGATDAKTSPPLPRAARKPIKDKSVTWKERKQYLIEHVRLEDAFRAAGVALKRYGKEWVGRCPMPDHHDRKPSCHVGGRRRDRWFCFSCGAGGNVIKLAEFTAGAGDWQAGIRWLETVFGGLEGNALETVAAATSLNKPRQTEQSQVEQKREPEEAEDEVETEESRAIRARAYQTLLELLPKIGDEPSEDSTNPATEKAESDWARAEIARRGIKTDEALAWGYRVLPSARRARVDIAMKLLARHPEIKRDRAACDDGAGVKARQIGLLPGLFQLPRPRDEKLAARLGDREFWCLGGDFIGRRRLYAARDYDARLAFADAGGVPVFGLLIPQLNEAGEIAGFKVRNSPFPIERFEMMRARRAFGGTLEENEYPARLTSGELRLWREAEEMLTNWPAKYQSLSSRGRKGGAQSRKRLHCRLGIGGDGKASFPEIKTIWVTEGEIKADLIWARMKVPVVSLPGMMVGHDELFELCAACAITTLVVALDEEETVGVARARASLDEKARACGMICLFARWQEKDAKGLDDLIFLHSKLKESNGYD